MFWTKRSKFKVMVLSNVLKNALSCLANATELHFTKFSMLMLFGARMNASVFKSKGQVQGHSMTKDLTGVGIQTSMLCVEFVFSCSL